MPGNCFSMPIDSGVCAISSELVVWHRRFGPLGCDGMCLGAMALFYGNTRLTCNRLLLLFSRWLCFMHLPLGLGQQLHCSTAIRFAVYRRYAASWLLGIGGKEATANQLLTLFSLSLLAMSSISSLFISQSVVSSQFTSVSRLWNYINLAYGLR